MTLARKMTALALALAALCLTVGCGQTNDAPMEENGGRAAENTASDRLDDNGTARYLGKEAPESDGGAEGQTGGTPAQAEPIPEEYAPVLEAYRRAAAENWDTDDCMAAGVNAMLGDCEPEGRAEKIGCALTDLDGDGTQELLIAATELEDDPERQKLIFDLYTIREGNAVLVFGSLDSNRLYYLGGDRFANVGYNDWTDGLNATLQFSDGVLHEIGGAPAPEDYVQPELTPLGEV